MVCSDKPLSRKDLSSFSQMNLKNLALAAFVFLTIVFALVAAVESDRAASTTTITSTSTVYSVTTSTSVVDTDGSQRFVLCEATTYSVAGTVSRGQTSNPTTTLGSTTYVTTTNETESSGYVTTSTQLLGGPTAPPFEVITCTYVS